MILRTIHFHLSVDNPHKYMFARTTHMTPQNYSLDIFMYLIMQMTLNMLNTGNNYMTQANLGQRYQVAT